MEAVIYEDEFRNWRWECGDERSGGFFRLDDCEDDFSRKWPKIEYDIVPWDDDFPY